MTSQIRGNVLLAFILVVILACLIESANSHRNRGGRSRSAPPGRRYNGDRGGSYRGSRSHTRSPRSHSRSRQRSATPSSYSETDGSYGYGDVSATGSYTGNETSGDSWTEHRSKAPYFGNDPIEQRKRKIAELATYNNSSYDDVNDDPMVYSRDKEESIISFMGQALKGTEVFDPITDWQKLLIATLKKYVKENPYTSAFYLSRLPKEIVAKNPLMQYDFTKFNEMNRMMDNLFQAAIPSFFNIVRPEPRHEFILVTHELLLTDDNDLMEPSATDKIFREKPILRQRVHVKANPEILCRFRPGDDVLHFDKMPFISHGLVSVHKAVYVPRNNILGVVQLKAMPTVYACPKLENPVLRKDLYVVEVKVPFKHETTYKDSYRPLIYYQTYVAEKANKGRGKLNLVRVVIEDLHRLRVVLMLLDPDLRDDNPEMGAVHRHF